METIETNRKALNKRQTKLRQLLTKSGDHKTAIQFFLDHHAQLHAAEMAQTGLWSFEDAILSDMNEAQIRRIPKNCEHSVAWCLWHLARIEDTAMNLLVAGSDQVASHDDWFERVNLPFRDCGNDMTPDEMAQLSETVHIQALCEYRIAVGRRTREIVVDLSAEDLGEKVDPRRLERVMLEGALREKSSGIRDYWGRRDIAGLLLMPASRHIIVHLNEALKLKRRKN